MKRVTYTPTRDRFLRDILRELFSHRQVCLLKQTGGMFVRGEAVRADRKILAGEEVVFSFPDRPAPELPVVEMDLRPVYEDEDYLIVDKGRGISCIPAGKTGISLLNGLKFLYPEGNFHVLTRLDRDTMGLVLLAKHPLAAERLCIASVEKVYEALVEGELTESLTIDAPVARRKNDIARVVSLSGKRAVTIVSPLRREGENTVAECRPLTGRTHQIRVHLAHIGHAVAGDTLYGSGVGEYNRGQNLLCRRLSFTQPLTGLPIEAVSARKFPEK